MEVPTVLALASHDGGIQHGEAKSLRDATDPAEPREAGTCGAPHPFAYTQPPVPKSIRARRVVQQELLRLVVAPTGVVAHAYAIEPASNLTRRALDVVMHWQHPRSPEPVSLTVYVPFDGTSRSGEYVPRSAIWASTKPGAAEAVRLASRLAAPSLAARYRRRTTRFVYGDSHRANALFMTVQDVAVFPEHAEGFDRQDDLLMGRLDFDERGLLLSADFYGPLVSESQRIGMIRTLNEHPEWSPAEARNAFMAGKPKYGPDDKDAFAGLATPRKRGVAHAPSPSPTTGSDLPGAAQNAAATRAQRASLTLCCCVGLEQQHSNDDHDQMRSLPSVVDDDEGEQCALDIVPPFVPPSRPVSRQSR